MTIDEVDFAVSSYEDWIAAEGVPRHEGFAVDLRSAEVAAWERFGVNGAVVNVAGRGDFVDVWLLDLPPAASSREVHHLMEVVVYVVSGHGTAHLVIGDQTRTFEWGPRSLFVIPMNATYQIHNLSGRESARISLTTSFPVTINLYRDAGFIFGSNHEFRDPISASIDYRGEGRSIQAVSRSNKFAEGMARRRNFWMTEFVPDVGIFDRMKAQEHRGKASRSMGLLLGNSNFHAGGAEIPVGSYKKAHRHRAGTHIFPVTGRGYSLLWYEGDADWTRVDWEHGLCFAPPAMMFHQHFNLSAEPSRYVDFNLGNWRYPFIERDMDVLSSSANQIEYEEEDPRIRELYKAELERVGVPFTLEV